MAALLWGVWITPDLELAAPSEEVSWASAVQLSLNTRALNPESQSTLVVQIWFPGIGRGLPLGTV